jgi:hypothetical protein
MTHDELLALIYRYSVGRSMLDGMAWDAICKVVELHKPQEITLPNGEWGANCGHCDIGFTYPCPTIQVIEKEL